MGEEMNKLFTENQLKASDYTDVCMFVNLSIMVYPMS